MIAEDAHSELIQVKKIMSKKKGKFDFALHFSALS